MAVTASVVQPFTMKDVSLVFGPTAGTQYEFRTQVDAVTFDVSSSTLSWTGLGLNSYTDAATPTWTCTLSYAQDWESANSLSQYLYTNEGQTIDVEFKPKNGSTKKWTGKVIIVPGAVGGPVNSVAVASVTLGMPAKPTFA